jgi:CubicO group peptidase (beta-lactamase class C family)
LAARRRTGAGGQPQQQHQKDMNSAMSTPTTSSAAGAPPRGRHAPRRRPAVRAALLVSCVVALTAACSSTTPSGSASPGTTTGGSAGTEPSTDPAKAATVAGVVKDVMASAHLKAAIVKVTIDGKEIITAAYGDSMTGVPATTDMHFRNGAVSISYMSTALLQLVDEKKVSLDDKVSKWLPDVPYVDQVTLGQLAQMTAGYVDYVSDPELTDMVYADPFKDFSTDDQIRISTKHPLAYPPGTNWNYSHTDYVILGLALEKITGMSLSDLLQQKVLGPLGLTNTTDPGTPAIAEPALHAFSSERRQALGIPSGKPFTEESTYWNPSWTLAHGAIETTNIDDMNTTAIGIGTGKLLSADSYQKMVSKDLIGKTTTVDGCTTCLPQQTGYTYGLGIVSSGKWLLQNPLFAGEGGSFAYLPSQKVAISVVTTFDPEAFDTATGGYKISNGADLLWRKIATALVPDEAPQIPKTDQS